MSAPTTTTEFSDIIEAVRAVEEHERDADLGMWDVAKLLIDKVGHRGKRGEHTGSGDKFEQISKVLVAKGYRHWSVIWLRKVRDTGDAYLFDASLSPVDRRLSTLSFWVHEAARNPDDLERIVKEAKGKKITVQYILRWHERQNPKPKRNAAAIIKLALLTALRAIRPLLAKLPTEEIEELIREATAFIAAGHRTLDERREVREAAE